MRPTKKIKFRKTVFGFLICSIIANGCATTSKQVSFEKKPKAKVLENIKNSSTIETLPSTEDIHNKLGQFKKSLNKKTLTEQDWKLHDELLDYYSVLKQNSKKVIVPANSKVRIKAETYCLNSSKSAPSQEEVYQWKKSSPGIEYFKELLSLRRGNKITQSELQGLLWSLQNETRWEEYPSKQKAILQLVDKNAPLNLPSNIKDKTTGIIKDQVILIPELSDAIEQAELLNGKYYELSDFKKSIERRTSKVGLSDYDELTKIPDAEIYTQSKSDGYSGQEVTLFNPTQLDQEIDLSDYYLQPERGDVQRIGINPRIDDEPSLLNDLEKTLYESMLRLGIGFTPGVNDVADIYELFSGKDFLTGSKLILAERALSGVGVIAGNGQAYRYANRILNAPSKYIADFERGIERAGGKAVVFIEKEEAKAAIQGASKKIEEISNFSELKKVAGFLKKENIVGSERRGVIEAFGSESKIKVLSEDKKVFRYWQEGTTNERGRWTTTLDTNNPVRDLALPMDGLYKKSEWIIPKGTEVIEGLVAPKFGKPGGGQQIWLPKPGVLK